MAGRNNPYLVVTRCPQMRMFPKASSPARKTSACTLLKESVVRRGNGAAKACLGWAPGFLVYTAMSRVSNAAPAARAMPSSRVRAMCAASLAHYLLGPGFP